MNRKTERKWRVTAHGENVIELHRHRDLDFFRAQALVEDPVNPRELTSIRALTSYVAYEKKVAEEVVQSSFETEFNLHDMSELQRADYERAIKFLIDLHADLLIN